MSRRTKSWIVIMGSFTAILVFCLLYLKWDIEQSKKNITVTHYTLNYEDFGGSFRIAELSDLHNSEYGGDNDALITLINEQEPDIICITGDLMNRKEDNTDIAVNLISNLTNIAPVYISLGNHEVGNLFATQEDVVHLYEEAGATVLEQQYVDVELDGEAVRIGGYFGYGSPDKDPKSTNAHTLFLREFQNCEQLKILLCHMPLSWYAAGSLDFWDADLVLCGHTHGGQIRLPIIGGVYAPDLGWFPGKEKGVYDSTDGERHMVLTTGLGNTEIIPRINNRPEIVVIDINENINE